MALVKYGAGIIQMSGSIAGDVHARNRFGNYIRPRTKPVNPRSERQEFARTQLSFLAAAWHSAGMDAKRGLWETYAAAVAMKNRLGETIHLTGFNHYIRTNAALLRCGLATVSDAPSIPSLPSKDVSLIMQGTQIAEQLFYFGCGTGSWTPDNDEKVAVVIYQGVPQLLSRNFYASPWRYLGHFDAETGALGSNNWPAVFAFATGQHVWFRGRVITKSGRVSETWQLGPYDTTIQLP